MKLHSYFGVLAAVILMGAAPAPSAPAPAQTVTGFHHDPTDLFGYYMPAHDIKFGKWQVNNIALATLEDFVTFEKTGKPVADTPEYGPVMIEFDDTTSPMVTTEEGGPVHKVQRRVLATAYDVRGGKVVFTAKDAVLGTIAFTGTIDVAAIKRMHQPNAVEDTTSVILKGDLTVGSRTVKNATFTWFGGD